MTYLTRAAVTFHRISGEEIKARRLVAALDPEERRVLTDLVDGKSLRAIAADIGIFQFDVEAAKSRLLRKLNAATTADLIRIAIYAGLEPDTP